MFFEVAKSILLIVSALFPIVNPIGGSPIFLLMTDEYSREERKLLARRVAMNSFILLIVPVVQVGGGLVVVSTGWAMLTRNDPGASGDRNPMHQAAAAKDIFRKAFYP